MNVYILEMDDGSRYAVRFASEPTKLDVSGETIAEANTEDGYHVAGQFSMSYPAKLNARLRRGQVRMWYGLRPWKASYGA